MDVSLHRGSESGAQSTVAYFRTTPITLCSVSDEADYDEMVRELSAQLDRFTNKGSGWVLNRIVSFVLHISQYRPLAGSSFIKSPDFIINKKCIVNVENKYDNKCFKWSVLAALHPAKDNSGRLCNYSKYENELNWEGVPSPTPLPHIRIFENNNPHISINVYIYKPEEGDAIIPTYITKHSHRKHHIDLLLLQDGDNTDRKSVV